MATQNSSSKTDGPGNLTLGEGVKLVGKLVVPGVAVINGVLEGELEADELLVGPKGSLAGKVRVRTADVHGATFDSLEASEFLSVRSTGQVHGQARYGEVEIEKGGIIRGSISPFASSDLGATQEPSGSSSV